MSLGPFLMILLDIDLPRVRGDESKNPNCHYRKFVGLPRAYGDEPARLASNVLGE